MFKFLLKKNFVDVWDNIFHVIITNAITTAVILFAIFILPWSASFLNVPEGTASSAMWAAMVLLQSILISIVVFAESENAAQAVSCGGTKFSSFFKGIPNVLSHAVAAGIFFGAVYMVIRISLPFYFAMFTDKGNFVFLALAAFLFWFLVVTALALQYLLPIYALMHNSFFKSLKKCYIIFFDNAAFSIGLGILNLINAALTLVTFGLAPGITGISITSTNALKLRLYKYDWLEVNPDLTKQEQKDVPWDELLKKDNEMLGPHPIKSALMPWKRYN